MRWQFSMLMSIALTTSCRANFETPERADAGVGVDAAAADAAPDPVLEVIDTAGEITVRAPGRFALTFSESANWQPQRWTDDSRGSIDLSGNEAAVEPGSLMTPLIICVGANLCPGASDMLAPTLDVIDADDRSVTLEMQWTWMAATQPLSGVATYTIDVDGVWEVEARLTNDDVAEIGGSMEIADTHVNDTLPWQITDALEGGAFSFAVSAENDLPRLQFSVELVTTLSTSVESDEPNNRYLVTPFSISAGNTQTVEWTARIWQDP